jgi:hypothetical protein
LARYWFRLRKLVLHNVLHADDTPHSISLGVAIATVVAFLPLLGLQTVISIGLAALCRANKAVCVPIVWITNPITFVPIYGACYALGRLVLPVSAASAEAEVLQKLEQAPQHRDFFSLATWKHIFDQLATLGMELWVGCLIVGVIVGAISYFLSRWAVIHFRERRRQHILKRNLLRAHRRATAVARREGVA